MRRAEDGQPHGGGHRSFGYKWVPDPKTDNKKMKLVVVPAEEKLIKKIVAKLTAGESAREVARWLNAEGVKTTTINKKNRRASPVESRDHQNDVAESEAHR